MFNMEKLDQYMADAGVFYLNTVDGDRPKSRPLGLHCLINGQIYYGVGNFKDVYKQLCANPNVEITACKGQDWIRVYGKAVFEQSYDLADQILEGAPFLKSIYNEETGYKMEVFHLEEATAEYRSMMKVEESFSF